MTISLYPLNDFILRATLKEVIDGSLSATPLTTGTVEAFLATSNSPTAEAADASLVASCVHVTSGKWRIAIDASVLTAALLDSLFGAAPNACYCIIQQSGGFRTYVPLTYVAARPATVT